MTTHAKATYDAFRKRIDDVILLAISVAESDNLDLEDFLEREFRDSLARLSEQGLIEREDE